MIVETKQRRVQCLFKRCQSLKFGGGCFWLCEEVKSQKVKGQASAAFLLEPFDFTSAPSAFLEPFGGRLTAVAAAVLLVVVVVVSEAVDSEAAFWS